MTDADALHALVARGVQLCYTSQTLGEFWNASTSAGQNGFGLRILETDRIARVIERDFQFLPDSQAVHDRWRQLLVANEIKGVQVHNRQTRGEHLYSPCSATVDDQRSRLCPLQAR